jgi:hypothetical protein
MSAICEKRGNNSYIFKVTRLTLMRRGERTKYSHVFSQSKALSAREPPPQHTSASIVSLRLLGSSKY